MRELLSEPLYEPLRELRTMPRFNSPRIAIAARDLDHDCRLCNLTINPLTQRHGNA